MLVNSDNKVRQLEGQIHQEQQASASTIKVILLLLASLDIVCYIAELATCSIYFLIFYSCLGG